MTQLAAGVEVLAANGLRLSVPYLFRDTFNRDDGPIDNGWTDGHDFDETYAPLGIDNNALACIDPTDNNNAGNEPPGADPYDGIGCIWRETDVTDIVVTARVAKQSDNWREAACLLHVTPGTDRHGVGAWLSTFPPLPNGFLLVGYIGNPATQFGLSPHALAVGTFTRSATTSLLEVRSVGGEITVRHDGAPIALTLVEAGDEGGTLGAISSFTVHPSLADSTLHGLAIDTHLEANGETGADNELDSPVINEVWMQGL